MTTTQSAPDWRERTTITVDEAAEVCGVCRSTAYTLARTGELPTLRLGRRFVVPTVALRRMLGEIPTTKSGPAEGPGLTKTADASSQDERYPA
jgi:excisionase family DNA binding protein